MAGKNISVDLGKIKTVVMNIEPAVERRKHMESLASSLGLQASFHHGPICTPYYLGCALSHLGALLKHGSELPLLILEDDVKTTESYKRVFDVPASADIVYLGCSTFGTSPDYSRAVHGFLLSEPFDDEYLRLLSMTSQHAILYTSPVGVQVVIDAMLVALCGTYRPGDVELSRLLPTITALTPRSVFFYQAGALQSSPEKGSLLERITLITPNTPYLSDPVEVDDPTEGKLRFGIKRNEEGVSEWRRL